jgi:NAD(P)H-hydrate epimerase
MRGWRPRVVLLTEPESLKGDARTNCSILLQSGLAPTVLPNQSDWFRVRTEFLTSSLLVDAILGTGLAGPVEGFYREVILDLNRNFASIPLVAVDVPSGMPSDTGEALGSALHADYTVTFTAPKLCHVFPPNCERVGELRITAIGTPPYLYENDAAIFLNLLGREDLAPFVCGRPSGSHKGSYGHALIVGGSLGKSGAAGLAALGAHAVGAGLVTAAVPAGVLAQVAGTTPVLMTEPLAENEAGAISCHAFDYGRFAGLVQGKSVVALGPGLSTHPETVEFAQRVVQEVSGVPLVVDADGLNAFAGAAELLRGEGRKIILTPHPGEMARLTGLTANEIQANRVDVARQFAAEHKAYVVLKGFRTLIAEPGGQVYVNPTGNPGMATGGTGDVLTGMIAGLLAQHPDAPVERVVAAAVYWHGAAGDAARMRRGELSLLATDLLAALPEALDPSRVPSAPRA